MAKKMQYYRLKNDCALRGWEKLTGVLLFLSSGKIRGLSFEEFQCLLLCDGETVISDELRTGEMQQMIDGFLQEEIILESQDPNPIAPAQRYRYYDCRYIPGVLWSITGHCNFRCRHCYLDAPAGRDGSLSTEECFDIIDQIAACGIRSVELTGGEPLVRSDFWDIVDRILKKKIHISQIYTNGWLVNEDLLNSFEERGIHPSFSMSFDGLHWHDWMRGQEGAEKQTLRALKLCREKGFPTNVEMCIHRGNVSGLMDTLHALEAVGVTYVKASFVSKTELWISHSDGNILEHEEYLEEVIKFIPEYFNSDTSVHLMLSGAIDLYTKKEAEKNGVRYKLLAERGDGEISSKGFYLCGAMRTTAYISPDGHVLPCMPIASFNDLTMFPDLMKDGLKYALKGNNYYMTFIDSRVKDLMRENGECADCRYVLRCCGGCRAHAFISEGDMYGTDRMMCTLWKEGYAERIRAAAEEALQGSDRPEDSE